MVLATLFGSELVYVIGELLEVLLLLLNLLLERKELLSLTLLYGVVLEGVLTALEGVTRTSRLGRSSGVAGSASFRRGAEGTEVGRRGHGGWAACKLCGGLTEHG